MHRNHHPSSKCTWISPLTHECTDIVTPQVNIPESYSSHMNAPKSSSLKTMHRNPTPHTWMHRNRHSSDKCTEILLHTFLGYNIQNPTPHTWMHWDHHSSSKCTGILPLTHECTEIVTPQVKAPKSYPSHMNASKSSSLKCTGILPLKHEFTKIVTPQVNAPKSYPPHMNAPKSSFLKLMQQNLTPHTWMHRNRHLSGKCTEILPLTHECIIIIIS